MGDVERCGQDVGAGWGVQTGLSCDRHAGHVGRCRLLGDWVNALARAGSGDTP